MSIFAHHTIQARFASLGEGFFQYTNPQPVIAPKLVSANYQAARLIGLSEDEVKSEEFLQLLAGQPIDSAFQPLASVYSGHQFGVYNPQLGDGRALILGDINGWQLQLKGSGKTAFSRFGDGRAVLRSSIREYLCSAAMHGLGIATTHAVAVIDSDSKVARESIESAAVILRLAPSYIRFGHFEYFYHTQQHDKLQRLADHVIAHFHPDLLKLDEAQRYRLWFKQIVEDTARLIAQWQAVGFCHGVMNTDNMSILALTLDYGPFAFLDDFNPRFICNHTDQQGRYAYHQQPGVALWNLKMLAIALSPLIEHSALNATLYDYERVLWPYYQQLMLEKLGLSPSNHEQDEALIGGILSLLAKEQQDYHHFFRQLSERSLADCKSLGDDFVDRNAFWQWLDLYQSACQKNLPDDAQRQQSMLAKNPKYILRNYLAQQAIEQAQAGNYQAVNDLLTLLQNPFIERPGFEAYSQKSPDWGKKLIISCSS